MTLWIILTAMCSAAAVLVAFPLIRRYEAADSSAKADTGFYAGQLQEIERDKGLGLIGEAEADLAKVEIERRLLAAAKSIKPPQTVSRGWRTVALVAVAGLVVLGATNLYALQGRPDLVAQMPALPPVTGQTTELPAQPAAAAAGNVDAMIEKLAQRLKQNPADADGWRMLGWSHFNRQRYEESAAAYAKAMELDPGNLDYKSSYAEALVQAAQGMVTPKARALFDQVLQTDPTDFRSRFYVALALEQAGDLDLALDQWIALLGDAPKDAGWLADVRQRIGELGQRTGRDVAALLGSQPSAQAADGGDLSAVDRRAMVDGMIAKLAAKLEANPRDRDGWAMMIRSLKVRGDMAGAQKTLSDALAAFADDPSTRTQIAGLAQSLGVETAAATAPVVTQEDIASAAQMPAEDQQAMIRGMVDRLTEKLDTSPHDAEGWMRLIRSRMVLNEPGKAREALRKAINEFSADATASKQIADEAKELGVTLD